MPDFFLSRPETSWDLSPNRPVYRVLRTLTEYETQLRQIKKLQGEGQVVQDIGVYDNIQTIRHYHLTHIMAELEMQFHQYGAAANGIMDLANPYIDFTVRLAYCENVLEELLFSVFVADKVRKSPIYSEDALILARLFFRSTWDIEKMLEYTRNDLLADHPDSMMQAEACGIAVDEAIALHFGNDVNLMQLMPLLESLQPYKLAWRYKFQICYLFLKHFPNKKRVPVDLVLEACQHFELVVRNRNRPQLVAESIEGIFTRAVHSATSVHLLRLNSEL